MPKTMKQRHLSHARDVFSNRTPTPQVTAMYDHLHALWTMFRDDPRLWTTPDKVRGIAGNPFDYNRDPKDYTIFALKDLLSVTENGKETVKEHPFVLDGEEFMRLSKPESNGFGDLCIPLFFLRMTLDEAAHYATLIADRWENNEYTITLRKRGRFDVSAMRKRIADKQKHINWEEGIIATYNRLLNK